MLGFGSRETADAAWRDRTRRRLAAAPVHALKNHIVRNEHFKAWSNITGCTHIVMSDRVSPSAIRNAGRYEPMYADAARFSKRVQVLESRHFKVQYPDTNFHTSVWC